MNALNLLRTVLAEYTAPAPGAAKSPADLEKKIDKHGGMLRVVRGPHTVFFRVSEHAGAFAVAVMAPSRWGAQFCPAYMVRLRGQEFTMRSVNTDESLTRRVNYFEGFEGQLVDAAIKLANQTHDELDNGDELDLDDAQSPAFEPSRAKRAPAEKPKPLHKLNDAELDKLLSQPTKPERRSDRYVDTDVADHVYFTQPRSGVADNKLKRARMHSSTKEQL